MSLVNNIALVWWDWMGAMFWQVSLLIIFISLLDYFLFKNVWPPVRYAVWVLVLVKLFIPPDFSSSIGLVPKIQPVIQQQFFAKGIDLHALSPSFGLKDEISTTSDVIKQKLRQEGGDQPMQSSEASAPPAINSMEKPVWQVYVMGIWLLGIFIFSGFLLTRIYTLRNWHDKQEQRQNIPSWFHNILTQTAQRLKLGKLPAIVYSEKAVTPAVYGLFHPVLLLPANYFDRLSSEEAEHVLLHELAHLKRGDLWLNSVCLFVQVVYWFNPLLIWARKQLKHICEMCCDLTVAGLLKDHTPAYRKTLLTTARGLLTESPKPGMGLLGVFEEPFLLMNRLKWLEKNSWKDKNLMFVTATIVFVFMAGLVLPMAVSEKQDKTNAGIKSDTETMLVENQESSWIRDLKIYKARNSDFIFRAKQTEPFYAVVLPMRGPISQLNDAMAQLQGYMRQNRIKPTGPSFIRQFANANVPVPEVDNIWEVGYPVAGKLSLLAPFVLKKIPAQNIIVSRLDQSFNEDEYNREAAIYLFNNNLVTSNASILYCPDKLFETGHHNPKWELQIPVIKTDKPFPKVPVYTKWTEAIVALVLPMQGSYDNELEALERLRAYLKEINVEPIGDPFFRYFNNSEFLPEQDVFWEAGYAVPKETKAIAPFEIKYIPEELVVCTEFTYDYDDILLYVNSFALSYIIEGYRGNGYPMRILKSGDLHGVELNEFRIPVRKERYNITSLPKF
ncbi:hypothetical protein JXQ31_14920 [candidate division KSB1 bacterium]|nr:hypothetical protein [candidate division KSB1 bacterium]